MATAKFGGINQGAIDQIANERVAKIALEVLAEAVAAVPQDTGNLGRSLVAEPRGRGVWVVGTDVYYAPFVEFGTRAHTVSATNARALRWKPKGGGLAFAKSVRIPAQPPRPFLGSALETVRRRWRLR